MGVSKTAQVLGTSLMTKNDQALERETRMRRFLEALASSLNLSIDLTIVTDYPDHFSQKAKEPEDQILGGKRVMTC